MTVIDSIHTFQLIQLNGIEHISFFGFKANSFLKKWLFVGSENIELVAFVVTNTFGSTIIMNAFGST